MVGPVKITTSPPTLRSNEQGRSTSTTQSLNQQIEQRQNQQAVQSNLDSGTKVLVEARRLGVTFRPIDSLRVVQARVIDRETEEVVRETPTTAKLRFSQKFRQYLSDVLGQRLDFRA